MEGPFQVDVQHPVKVLLGYAHQQAVPGNARVVDQHRRRAEGVGAGLKKALAGGHIGHVGPVAEGTPPRLLAKGAGGLRLLLAAGVVDDHLAALGRQRHADGPADAPAGPGDNGGASGDGHANFLL